jgi:formylglycine-generating enzyme required for sulfatase activity/tRNA A-37 threonylcarbamoyl transferase component Bud32
MLIYKKSSTLAIRHILQPEAVGAAAEVVVKQGAQVLGHIAEEAAGKLAGDAVKKLVEGVRSHFADHSERVTLALAASNEKAWKTIEIALGGQRFWDRFASAEDQALRGQVKAFLESSVAEDDPAYLTTCLKELRQAREKAHLEPGKEFRPEGLAEEVGSFARFDNPEALLEAECAVVGEVAREFQRLGYRHLGRLLAVTPTRGQPLLAMAVQYYFRRAVGEDPVLARELTWAKMLGIDRRVQDGFAFLALIQERHGQAIDATLDSLARVEVVFVETRESVRELHAEVRELTDQFKLLRRDLTPGHSVSYRDEHERALIEAVKRRYRALSDEQRRRFPQLGLDLSRLEIVAGDFKEALAEARGAARSLDDPASRAEAHHTAYRAALELKSWDQALDELRKAIQADARFGVLPAAKYQVDRILGAGAFGVAFLCRDTYLDRRVVIKTFEATGIDRDVATVFREARILNDIQAPGIIRLFGCGFVDETRRLRPYLEIEHLADSLTLEDHVQQHGPLSVDDLLPIAVQTARALEAAHDAGVWHRDLKPANLLVRKTTKGWVVKVIDFGLSLRRSLVQTSHARAVSPNRSMVGSAVAGTLNYAAPEQLDRDRSNEVGPHSDVFGFGRTCYFALYREPYPDQEDLDTLPQPWKDLLGRCTAKKLDRRPKDFGAVLERLTDIQSPREVVVTPPPVTVPPSRPPAAMPAPKPGPSPRFTNSLGMTLVRIEPGEFLMGSTKAQMDMLLKQFPDAKREWFAEEQPQHPVTITRPFYLAAHQVTVGQFRRFVEASGYKTDAEKSGEGAYGLVGKEWKQGRHINWRNPGFKQDENHPVVCVSHNDALAFLGWLNQQEKTANRSYCLPTEAEWEYACRAGTRGLYGGSADPESLVSIANVADASLKKILPNATCIRGDDGFVYTAPVGSFEPNAWHLYDMIGNVWEWCDDWFDAEFYQTSPKEDPRNMKEAPIRVFRGGSWINDPGRCRPANRIWFSPAYRSDSLGFRVAAVQE